MLHVWYPPVFSFGQSCFAESIWRQSVPHFNKILVGREFSAAKFPGSPKPRGLAYRQKHDSVCVSGVC